MALKEAAGISRSTEADGLVVGEGFCRDSRPQLSFDTAKVQAKSGDMDQDLARTSVGAEGGPPPASPFGDPLTQGTEPAWPPPSEEVENTFEGAELPERLLSGLSSLSHEDFTLYMQLTKELAKELEADHAEITASGRLVEVSSNEGSRSLSEEAQFQNAVKKLESMLPKSAINQLQSYASYGLLDVLYASQSQENQPEDPSKQLEVKT